MSPKIAEKREKRKREREREKKRPVTVFSFYSVDFDSYSERLGFHKSSNYISFISNFFKVCLTVLRTPLYYGQLSCMVTKIPNVISFPTSTIQASLYCLGLPLSLVSVHFIFEFDFISGPNVVVLNWNTILPYKKFGKFTVMKLGSFLVGGGGGGRLSRLKHPR